MPITRDGIKELILATLILGIPGGLAAWAAVTHSPWWWVAAVPFLVLLAFVFSFFRDPHRVIPTDAGIMVAPADGKVTEVAFLDEWPGIDGRALKISIFLSVFNVHINRAPCDGRVTGTEYGRGEFLDVRHPESGIRNERNTITIDPDADYGPVIVRQIAGLIARRIVCHVAKDDAVRRGARFGMIKFGSRTDLIVPVSSGLAPAVAVGDIAKGGATVLMRPKSSE